MKKFFEDLIGFIKNVVADSRIPERDKKILGALVLLLISPFDIIPDWIPIIGVIDDFIILAIVLDYLFNVLDSEILLTHYPWGMKSFVRLRRTARMISLFAPEFVKKKVWAYIGSPYKG